LAMRVHIDQLLFEEADSLVGEPAVTLELGFTRATKTNTSPAGATGLSAKVAPHAGEARQAVLQLGKLDLQSTFARLGTPSEHIENQCRAINNFQLECLLQVSLLGG